MELYESSSLNLSQSSSRLLGVPNKTPQRRESLSTPTRPLVLLTPPGCSPTSSPLGLKRSSPHLLLPETPRSKRQLTPNESSGSSSQSTSCSSSKPPSLDNHHHLHHHIKENSSYPMTRSSRTSTTGCRKRPTGFPLPPIRVDLVTSEPSFITTTSSSSSESLLCIDALTDINVLSREDRISDPDSSSTGSGPNISSSSSLGDSNILVTVPSRDEIKNYHNSQEQLITLLPIPRGFNSYIHHLSNPPFVPSSNSQPPLQSQTLLSSHHSHHSLFYLPPRSKAPVNRSTILLLETYQKLSEILRNKQKEKAHPNPPKKALFYPIREGEILNSKYKVIDFLGKGAFGQVVKAQILDDHQQPTDQLVAIKIIRKSTAFLNLGKREVQILKKVNQSADNFIVKFMEQFIHQGHLCIVFELLSYSLLDLVNLTLQAEPSKPGLSLRMVHKLTHQLVCALATLENMQIIHCDLKPENVALTSPNRAHIKVLDFGSSCHVWENTSNLYPYIQSRYYRAPEVLLGCRYGLPIDMWSLGCIVLELYTAKPLFVGQDAVEQLYAIIDVLGYPPHQMLQEATHLKKFFKQLPDGSLEYKRKHKPKPRTIETIIHSKMEDPEHLTSFIDLVTKMLTYDPEKRLKPYDALRHPFIVNGPNTNKQQSQKPFSEEFERKLSPLCKTAN